MSISTYTTLKAQVFAFSGRDDLSSSFDTIIQLAEQYIYHNSDQPLRSVDLISTATLTTVGGVNSLALPTGFMGALSIMIVSGGVKSELVNTSPASLGRNGQSGIPRKYAITDVIVFDYIPSGAYSIELTYYAQPAALSLTDNTNIILTKYPSIYLDGCLSCVNKLSGEAEDSEMFYQQMMRGIKGVIRSNRKTRHSPSTAATNSRTWTP